MPRWLVVILVLFVGFLLLSMAAFIALPFLLQAFLPKVGTVLVYEMEVAKPPHEAAYAAEKTVAMLDRRLNRGFQRRATIRAIGGNRIEVGVYGNDPATVEYIAECIERSGTLEFRIVANVHKHQKEIEIAKNEPGKTSYDDSKGEWSARWIPFKRGEKFDPQTNLVRTRKLKDKEINEVLVVRDFYDVTGDFLANARPGVDYSGKPCVLFSFSSKGGQLFGMLTGDNLPDQKSGAKNQLGIVLNGVMYSAPNIQAIITDHGQITGNFTQSEVDRIVSCLNAGSLPVNLRKVEQRSAGAN
ncbi:MAG: hypothetical protein IT426_11840 [Pirellulales bacterium]|nr:hypothetical protein [Pirellulales bacterium]